MNRTRDKRELSSLFVASLEPLHAVSRATIFSWIVECVQKAGDQAVVGDWIRVHDTFEQFARLGHCSLVSPWLRYSRWCTGPLRTLSLLVISRTFF